MEKKHINGQTATVYRYNTVIVGAGAAGMNCAKKLYEYMDANGVENPHRRIAVITAGVNLGTSRMAGSDKQTYYKMSTSPETPDSPADFAKSLTAAGCCHHDLALAEAVGSLRGFYNLVEAGVPFPYDDSGACLGYKTDHDCSRRATSAGPRTSLYMSQCLEKKVRRYGIEIFDHQLVFEFLTNAGDNDKRITAAAALNTGPGQGTSLNIFCCQNLVLAAGGPGRLYRQSVYPPGQTSLHGAALEAGLAAENLTESQFGLASTKFRWNVSGSYMQAVPRIFSTDAHGNDPHDFLADYFPDISTVATAIFLKGYQWPFDAEKIQNYGSSLIDILVHDQNQKGRRVFMDFRQNPRCPQGKPFSIDTLKAPARDYLQKAHALQKLPIERLAHMNQPAIELYKQNGIDLYTEPLEIAVCAQHNNGGLAVDKWWQSNIAHTFVIGEMAGTHGVKRPGGSALNAGQVGAQRAAEYIANVYGWQLPQNQISHAQIKTLLNRLKPNDDPAAVEPEAAIEQIQRRMSESAAHIRRSRSVENALEQAIELHHKLKRHGLKFENKRQLITALQARDLALASVAYLSALKFLLAQGGGSRCSYLVLDEKGTAIHPDIKDHAGKILKYKPENKTLRDTIVRLQPSADAENFHCHAVPVRPVRIAQKAFETGWADYRAGRIYNRQEEK